MGFDLSEIKKTFDTIYEVVYAIVELLPAEVWTMLEIALAVIIALVIYKLTPLS